MAAVLVSDAKKKLEYADFKYNEQLNLNRNYSALQNKYCILEKERDRKASELVNLRYAVGISPTDKETDPVQKITAIRDENSAIKRKLDKELRLPFRQQKSTATLEMLDMVLDKFKSRIAETDKELEESRSVIAKLKEQLSFIKQEFVKVVLAVNTLVYSDKYCRGLSGLSKALATGISFFTDSTFKKLGEYDSINKCAIDDEIRENMSHFIEPEKNRTSSYYER